MSEKRQNHVMNSAKQIKSKFDMIHRLIESFDTYVLLHFLSLGVLRSGQIGFAFGLHFHTLVKCFDVWESEDKRRKVLV